MEVSVSLKVESPPDPKDPVFKKLRIFNGVVGLAFLAQAIAVLLLSSSFRLPLTTTYVGHGTNAAATVTRQIALVRMGPLVALFLFISVVAHFTIIMPRVFEWYVRNLGKNVNYARWIEYAFSSSVMIWIIAMLAGMYDLSSLILIFFLNMMMILFGWMMEVHNQTTEKTNWTAFYFGCIAGAVPWVIIFLYFISAAVGGNIPGFVYGIMVSLFILFNIFAVNMVLQYKKVGPWKDYLFAERAYVMLSLVAKSLLAWQVFAGTLARK
jgi:hypothetical protein